jgi:purine-binding chemotaxis protein CheW
MPTSPSARSRTAPDKSGAKGAASTAPLTHITEFLAFKLGTEEYGIDILRVQEIRSYEAPTHIANAPDGLLGVLDLRGVIVPIVDMRMKFNLGEVRYDPLTVVIVLNIGSKVVGMVVDSVSDVISLEPGQLRPSPEFSSRIDSGHILAIGAVDDRMLILMDVEKLMSSPEWGLITTAAPSSH